MTEESSGSPDGEPDDEEVDAVAGMYDQGDDGPTIVPDPDDADGDVDDEEEGDNGGESPLDYGSPLMGEEEPERVSGTFYVKGAEETALTLHDIETAQIFVVIENPGYEAHDIIEADLVAQPPMEVSYLFDEVHEHYQITVEESPEPPTRQITEMAQEELEPMEVVAVDRAGTGEIHVLRTEPDHVAQTAEELPEDEMTYKNAARQGIERVEIRTDEEIGLVSIRYMP